jgi:ArsR family transcriptional regulator
MVQVRKRRVSPTVPAPRSPREAVACCRAVDDLLDPTLFKALGDPTRTLILGCLIKCGRACAVGEIAECCSVDLSVVSRHLQTLDRAGLVESSRCGRNRSYLVRYASLCSQLRGLADSIEECAPGDAASNSPACACTGGRRGGR